MTTPSPISISQPPNSFFVSIGTSESRRNIWFRRPQPLSLPTTTKAGETCGFAAQIHPALTQPPRHPHLQRMFEIVTVQLVKRTATNPARLR